MADHLLNAIGQNLLAEFGEELLFDALDGRLAQLRRGFEARDVVVQGEEAPDALAQFGVIERGEFLGAWTRIA